MSDHWDGHGADIAAFGADLVHLGQSALVAAGMPSAEALQQTGGLHDLIQNGLRVQIIFNSTIGNHTECLHVGIRDLASLLATERGCTLEQARQELREAGLLPGIDGTA